MTTVLLQHDRTTKLSSSNDPRVIASQPMRTLLSNTGRLTPPGSGKTVEEAAKDVITDDAIFDQVWRKELASMGLLDEDGTPSAAGMRFARGETTDLAHRCVGVNYTAAACCAASRAASRAAVCRCCSAAFRAACSRAAACCAASCRRCSASSSRTAALTSTSAAACCAASRAASRAACCARSLAAAIAPIAPTAAPIAPSIVPSRRAAAMAAAGSSTLR